LKVIEPFYPVAGLTAVSGANDAARAPDAKKLTWKIATRRHKLNAMPDGKEKTRLQAIEKATARIRVRVEHPFRVTKRQFGHTKVRFRGLAKNAVRVPMLFALSNLWMARKQLLGSTGKLRPKYACKRRMATQNAHYLNIHSSSRASNRLRSIERVEATTIRVG
jgi:hypothetical protein